MLTPTHINYYTKAQIWLTQLILPHLIFLFSFLPHLLHPDCSCQSQQTNRFDQTFLMSQGYFNEIVYCSVYFRSYVNFLQLKFCRNLRTFWRQFFFIWHHGGVKFLTSKCLGSMYVTLIAGHRCHWILPRAGTKKSL